MVMPRKMVMGCPTRRVHRVNDIDGRRWRYVEKYDGENDNYDKFKKIA